MNFPNFKSDTNLKNRTANSIRNATIGICAQFLQVIGSFICRMIFVRCLSKEYLGVNGLFVEVISILSIAELGISASVTFELYKALAEEDESLCSSLMQFYRRAYHVIGIVIAVIGLSIMPFIGGITNKDSAIHENIYLLYVLYLSETVLSYFFSYKQTLLQASQQNYIISIIEMITGLLKNTFQILFLITTKNFIYYQLLQIVFRLINNVSLSIIIDHKYPNLVFTKDVNLPQATYKILTKNMRYIFVTNLFSKLVNSTDTILISTFVGLSAAGVNSNYILITSTMQIFTSKVLDGVTGSIGNINATETKKKQINLFNMTYLAFYWLLLWCTCCFVIISSDAIEIFFGREYLMPMSVVIVIGLNFFQQQLFNTIINYRATLGLFKYGRYTTLFTGIINIVLSVTLGKRIGVFGILIATFISRMLTLDWHYPLIVFKYGFYTSPINYFKESLVYWAEAGLILFISLWMSALISTTGIISVAYKLLICMIIPNFLFIIFNDKKSEYKELKTRILRYFKTLFSKKWRRNQ